MHHRYSEGEALDLQVKLNVAGLANALRSDVAEDYFAKGWEFDRILLYDEKDIPVFGEEFIYSPAIPIAGNRWLDSVVLRRRRDYVPPPGGQ